MKSTTATVLLLGLALAAPARAGDVPAGPAAAAAPGVGSIVTPASHVLLNTLAKDDRQDRIAPGDGGAIILRGEQLAQTAQALRGFEGASAEGNTVRAPTVLADGTAAVIALNTETGQLSVTRRVK